MTQWELSEQQSCHFKLSDEMVHFSVSDFRKTGYLFGKKITLDPYLKVQVKINSLWIINYDPPEATTQNYCKKTWENIL